MKKEYIKRNLIRSLYRKGFMFILFCLLGTGYCFSQPTITCPSNITVNAASGICGAYVTYAALIFTPSGATLSLISGKTSGSLFPKGVTTNKFKVTDGNNKTATCSFTITVNDIEKPVITFCPSNQNVNTNTGCTYVHPNNTQWNATATDNCPPTTVPLASRTYTLAGVTIGTGNSLANAVFQLGCTTVTWTATDASGNASTCIFMVCVTDITRPKINCPADIVVDNKTGSCDAIVTYSDPVYSDNCPGGVTMYQYAGFHSGATFPIGTTNNCYRATDASGNAASCCFKVTVNDAQLPLINCPMNQTKSSNMTGGKYLNTGTFFDPTSFSDNCPVTGTWPKISYTVMNNGVIILGPSAWLNTNSLSGKKFNSDINTVTWNVKDKAGNISNCIFTVTVNAKSTSSIDEGTIVVNENGVLLKNYPNPFSQMTTVVFSVPEDTYVKLDVYDMTGRLVNNLFAGDAVNNQDYTVEFDCNACPNGIYLYKMTTGKAVYTGKMMLLKE